MVVIHGKHGPGRKDERGVPKATRRQDGDAADGEGCSKQDQKTAHTSTYQTGQGDQDEKALEQRPGGGGRHCCGVVGGGGGWREEGVW